MCVNGVKKKNSNWGGEKTPKPHQKEKKEARETQTMGGPRVKRKWGGENALHPREKD